MGYRVSTLAQQPANTIRCWRSTIHPCKTSGLHTPTSRSRKLRRRCNYRRRWISRGAIFPRTGMATAQCSIRTSINRNSASTAHPGHSRISPPRTSSPMRHVDSFSGDVTRQKTQLFRVGLMDRQILDPGFGCCCCCFPNHKDLDPVLPALSCSPTSRY